MSDSLAALVPVSLISFCIETLLYGCFLVLFALSLCLMINVTPSIHGERRPYPRPMLWFSILIFFLVTAHWILSAVQAFQGFVLHHNSRATAEFFANLSEFSSILRSGVLMGLFMISDLTIIYRLWLVWGHNRRVVILPIILLFAFSAFAVMTVYEYTSDENIVQNGQTAIIGICVTSISINFYCAGMIVCKLCQAGKATRDWENVSWFKFTIIILVESLALYTIWGVLFTIFYGLKSPINRVFGDTQCPIIGIAFVILHVRVGMRRLGRDASTLVEGRPRTMTQGA
ncbi:hypothetical protein BD779DRAFT_1527340 [Infundibulicybe gibba]|nr:hypothetical protein BD779DRAFT_1527340 [Infundibulicybe gibba]